MTCMPVTSEFYVTSGFGPRWGTFHYGTDFGRDGGCGGHPVFAIRAGRVAAVGPASGFGQWVCVDHPAEVGGGYSVYGHVIPEVSIGQQVVEGQRIARINPDSRTNGGVAPHLHLEFHRRVWSPPGSDRLDPMTILQGAHHPGQQPAPTPAGEGVIFGVDVSEHQRGMSLGQAAREGIKFAIIRTTDGTYRDSVYRSHVDDARRAGLVCAAYHYLRNPSEGTSVRQQVDTVLDVMGEDHRLPIWLDCETNAGLTVDHIREFKRLFEDAGIRVIGAYSYVPWWEGRVTGGEPDSHEFGAFWVAAYGADRAGAPAAIYPGNDHPQWRYPLGNQMPTLWQFGSRAQVAGCHVDINAYRGDIDELRALFEGEDMSLLSQILGVCVDIQRQMRGGELRGWKQLGKNAAGDDLTVVDAIAAIRHDLSAVNHKVDLALRKIEEGK